MSPAPRKPQNRGLPRNLTTHPKGYRYKHPLTGKYHYLGKSVTRADAIAAAEQLNSRFACTNSLADRVSGGADWSMRNLVALHLSSLSSDEAPKTKADREWELGKLSRKLGSADASELNTHALAIYLRGLSSDHVRKRYRMRLVELFDTAVQNGWRENNPARVLPVYKPKTQRQRLTADGFELIRATAAPWLQHAMDLALQTLQRRDDIVKLKWSQIESDVLKIEQGKTGRRLAIHIGKDLREVLQRCRDNIASPFVIHRLPEKSRPSRMRALQRTHHTEVLPEQLTRAFSHAVKRSGLSVAAGRSHPTFHEIRSLGISLYHQSGWSVAQVQALAGHADEAMTRHYMEGHEAPWQPVESGLQLGRKRY